MNTSKPMQSITFTHAAPQRALHPSGVGALDCGIEVLIRARERAASEKFGRRMGR
jgi:hypothetical protein